MTIDQLKEKIPSYDDGARNTLDELAGYIGSTFENEAALLEAIKDDPDELDDAIHEIADGRVSVYTADRLEWLATNLHRANQEEAIACGARDAGEIAAWCWYEAERDEIRDDLGTLANLLSDEAE